MFGAFAVLLLFGWGAGAMQQDQVSELERAAMVHAKAGEYDKAEDLLSRALASEPGSFKLLYNLGVAASFAGHNERARDVLERARKLQPGNVDVLYSLAYVNQALKENEAAVRLLAQAARLAPGRSDTHKLLAIITGDLGAFADSLAAWDRYLKLQPNDDFARRERAYTAVLMGQFEEGIAGLERFLAKHPDDAVAHYELGLAHSAADLGQALQHLDEALALRPDFIEARSARGSLYYRQGKPEAALADLEFAAERRPDALNLDRLGQTYLALDRPSDAVRALRRAAELAPEDSTIQLHFGRALAEAGQIPESKVAMERFRQLGPSRKRAIPPGLVQYLSLTPEQQRADYLARVEEAVRKDPKDAGAQERHLQLLLEKGDLAGAVGAVRRIRDLKPGAVVLARTGRALLAWRQYSLAKEVLEQAVALEASAGVKLDLAIAAFHAAGPSAGLEHLDRMPEVERSADYYLARAQMLGASGKSTEAAQALDNALRTASERPDLYQQAGAFLIANGQVRDAMRVFDQAARILPRSREMLLLKAATLEIAGSSGEAGSLLHQIQNRWPEWHAGWVAEGVILTAKQQFEQARQALETAIALGAQSPEAYYCLAEATLYSPGRIDEAQVAIRKALKLAPDDPRVRSLAGRIASAVEVKQVPPESERAEKGSTLRRLVATKPPQDW